MTPRSRGPKVSAAEGRWTSTAPRLAGLFYQAGIVHAAEASMSQLLNLMLAYLLLRCFGIGRHSAASSMNAKIVSFFMVTIGLFLCTLGEEPHKAAAPPSSIPIRPEAITDADFAR